jgi:hypothetical protein
MDSSTDSGRRPRFLGGLSRRAWVAAVLTAVLVLVAGAIAVAVVIPWTSRADTLPAWPAAEIYPSAPLGWTVSSSLDLRSSGSAGLVLPAPAPRIAIHVTCSGFDGLVVLASTSANVADGQPLEAARFDCSGEARVELTAPSGSFKSILASIVLTPSSYARGDFQISIEIPDEPPSAAASASR